MHAASFHHHCSYQRRRMLLPHAADLCCCGSREAHRSQPRQCWIDRAFGMPAVMSTCDRMQLTHIPDGFGSMLTPHYIEKPKSGLSGIQPRTAHAIEARLTRQQSTVVSVNWALKLMPSEAPATSIPAAESAGICIFFSVAMVRHSSAG